MKLYEFEGKNILSSEKIPVPGGRVVKSLEEANAALKELDDKVVVKGQLLSGKRMKSGLVKICDSKSEGLGATKSILGSEANGEHIKSVLIENFVDVKSQYYLSIVFDTNVRLPVVLFSTSGGIDVEQSDHARREVDLSLGFQPWMARELLKRAGVGGRTVLRLSEMVLSFWNIFRKYDCRILEVNPLIENHYGDFYAADVKMVLDDDALFRHPELKFEPRGNSRKLSQAEMLAKEIDKNDHRGTAGSTYVDLDGDIAVLASGGGASMVCMDSLLAYGGRPSNYTEYSGDPPAEKVERLTKIALSKTEINGCWVVGGTANFTDIYETLRGFLNGLRSMSPKPKYPIVIRRAGPRDEEAFEMLRKVAEEEGYNMHVFGSETSLTATAKIMTDLANEYRKNKRVEVSA